MTTAQLADRPAAALRSPLQQISLRAFTRLLSQLSALLAVTLYAAFDHGAVSLSAQARLNAVLALLAMPGAAGWLWRRERPRISRTALVGLGLMVAFVVLNGASLLWSVDPDGSWAELNRTASYLLVLLLGISLGASSGDTPVRLTRGYLIVLSVVGLYALAGKLLPGLHVGGLFDLNESGPITRLQQPLGYWNALALLLAFGVVLALGQASDRDLRRAHRTGAVLALGLMLITGGLTLSRGGTVALIVALVAFVLMSRVRFLAVVWLAVAAAASAPALAFGLLSPALTEAGSSLTRRQAAGFALLVIVVLSAAALGLATWRLMGVEERLRFASTTVRRLRRLLPAVLTGVLIAIVVGFGLSSPGLGGTVSHAWRSFIETHAVAQNDASRLLSADSEHRWVWWKEAAGAFSDRPVVGWGAGSFGVVHLLYRRDQLSVRQAHSVPLQWLAETGLLGMVLAVGALAALGLAAARALPLRIGRSHPAVAAMLAVLIAAAVHGLYDWDWDIPALVLPVMLFLGALIGITAGPAAPGNRIDLARRRRQPIFGLALVTLLLCALAVSGILPSVAADDAASASVTAAAGSTGALLRAQDQAARSTALDPLSDAGLRVQSTIELARGRAQLARLRLLDAVRRNPSDSTAWTQLSTVELSLGLGTDAARAAARALALDPQGRSATSFARTVAAFGALRRAPPQSSATGQASSAP